MSPESTAASGPSGHTDATRRQKYGLIFVGILGLLAAGFSYLGTRDAWVVADRSPGEEPEAPAVSPVDTAWDFELPEGPHRAEFQTSCLICHSARLPFGQPPFKKEKWAEVVHKMVAVYGAPMTPRDESEVVDYLLAARPPAP